MLYRPMILYIKSNAMHRLRDPKSNVLIMNPKPETPQREAPHPISGRATVGALIIRIGFWGFLP